VGEESTSGRMATAMPKSMLSSRSKALKRQKIFCGNQSSTLVVPSNTLNQRCASCVARRVVSLAKHCGQTCVDTTDKVFSLSLSVGYKVPEPAPAGSETMVLGKEGPGCC
jgi:hypothetical protein